MLYSNSRVHTKRYDRSLVNAWKGAIARHVATMAPSLPRISPACDGKQVSKAPHWPIHFKKKSKKMHWMCPRAISCSETRPPPPPHKLVRTIGRRDGETHGMSFAPDHEHIRCEKTVRMQMLKVQSDWTWNDA